MGGAWDMYWGEEVLTGFCGKTLRILGIDEIIIFKKKNLLKVGFRA
jgi:hypothetical protein